MMWVPLRQALEYGARLVVPVLVPQQSCPVVQGRWYYRTTGVTLSDFFPGSNSIFNSSLPFVKRREDIEHFRSQGASGKLGSKLLRERLGLRRVAFLG